MKTNYILAILAVIGGVAAAFTNYGEKNDLYPDWKYQKGFISAPYLADLLYSKEEKLTILDAREWEAYENYHIPLALKYDTEMESDAGIASDIIVIYGETGDQDLYNLAKELPGRVYLLKGGLEDWYSLVLFPDFNTFHVRNGDQLDHILRRSLFFGGKPRNTQLLNINVRESRFREGC